MPAAGADRAGVHYDPLRRRFQPPDEATIRRVLEAVDAAAQEAAVGSWLAARLQGGRPPELRIPNLLINQETTRAGAWKCPT